MKYQLIQEVLSQNLQNSDNIILYDIINLILNLYYSLTFKKVTTTLDISFGEDNYCGCGNSGIICQNCISLYDAKSITQATDGPSIWVLLSTWNLYSPLYNKNITELPNQISTLVNLTYLNLSYNLIHIFPSELPPNLNHLDLSHNRLTTIPPIINKFIKLEKLFVDNNNITSIPPEIGELTNLRTLDLNDNKLTEISPEIGTLLCLKALDLDNNQLKDIPNQLSTLTNLEILYLHRNRFYHIPTVLNSLTNLRRLYLSYYPRQLFKENGERYKNIRLTDIQRAYSYYKKEIPPELSSLTRLTSLHISVK